MSEDTHSHKTWWLPPRPSHSGQTGCLRGGQALGQTSKVKDTRSLHKDHQARRAASCAPFPSSPFTFFPLVSSFWSFRSKSLVWTGCLLASQILPHALHLSPGLLAHLVFCLFNLVLVVWHILRVILRKWDRRWAILAAACLKASLMPS